MERLTIAAVLTGKAVPFGPAGEPSAMAKSPVTAPQKLGYLGFEEDEQGDLSVHGGPDKAVHHYPRDHYAWWDGRLDGHELLRAAGAFGENISTMGVVEDDVCIGDRYRIGSALVEISQGRQPCWKLNHHFGRADILRSIVETRRGGWYYRVIEPGEVSAGDAMTLVARTQPEWSVARTFALLIAGGHRGRAAELAALAAMPELAENWRARAMKLLDMQ
jgi:MOSC domain-containing protein YiiM